MRSRHHELLHRLRRFPSLIKSSLLGRREVTSVVLTKLVTHWNSVVSWRGYVLAWNDDVWLASHFITSRTTENRGSRTRVHCLGSTPRKIRFEVKLRAISAERNNDG